MKRRFTSASICLAVAAACLFSAQGLWAQSAKAPAPRADKPSSLLATNAGCGFSLQDAPAAPAPPQKENRQPEGSSRQPSLVMIAAHNDEDSEPGPGNPGIVGLWKVKFVSPNSPGTNDGISTVVDQGYATWHSDGTEIMNSGRPPISGNFCMGVWEFSRHGTIKLNHWALGWDTTPIPSFIGPANIKEEIALDRTGNNYIGSFTIDQYEATGTTVILEIKGTVTGQRITVD